MRCFYVRHFSPVSQGDGRASDCGGPQQSVAKLPEITIELDVLVRRTDPYLAADLRRTLLIPALCRFWPSSNARTHTFGRASAGQNSDYEAWMVEMTFKNGFFVRGITKMSRRTLLANALPE